MGEIGESAEWGFFVSECAANTRKQSIECLILQRAQCMGYRPSKVKIPPGRAKRDKSGALLFRNGVNRNQTN